jgi:hypothetical protein
MGNAARGGARGAIRPARGHADDGQGTRFSVAHARRRDRGPTPPRCGPRSGCSSS